MLVLLSPAKKLNTTRTTALPLSEPRLKEGADGIVKIAERLSASDLKSLMKLSDPLAELNAGRYTDFHAQDERPAALMYDGDTYWGLDADSLDDDGLKEADYRVRILSGLYGLLRPLDAIRPHRMEMGTRLKTSRGKSLYDYWGPSIAEQIRDDLAGRDEEAVLNLASNEYFKAVDRQALDRPVVTAKFLNVKDGEPRNLGLFAKRARGQLARFVIDNRIDRVAGAKDFNYGGYGFDADASTEETYVFTRTQPEPGQPETPR